MEIKNLKKVADRIKKAIKNKENIILYGDADVDGITSLIILKETILNLGGKVSQIYFPSREIEGYGITKRGLEFLKDFAPALLIALDCGITNFKEVLLAKKMKFEVIIIDHHEIIKKLPSASIIVNPKQKGDKYQFKGLATAGIVLKLSQVILKEKFSPNLRKSFFELAALATLADLMPQEGENLEILQEGLTELKNSWRPGIAVFWEIDEIKKSATIREACQKIASILNTIVMSNGYPQSYLILTASDYLQAKELVSNLLLKRKERQEEIRKITEEVKERIFHKKDELIIFEGDSSWPLLSVGAVASRICHLYQKPVFIYSKKDKISRGAVRTPAGVNGVELMKKCSKYLISFGGHSQAGGFHIENKYLEKFKECLTKNYKSAKN